MKVRGRQENKMVQNATRIGKPKTRAQHKKREIENMKMNTEKDNTAAIKEKEKIKNSIKKKESTRLEESIKN